MHCINCGKPIDGEIPLCRDCAMLVIQGQSKANEMARKIDAEAQEFSILSEEKKTPTPIYQPVYRQEPIRPTKQKEKDDELKKLLLTFFGIAILFLVFLGFLGSLF